MKVTIVGIKKATTKNGKNFCQYFITKPFSDYDMEKSEVEGIQASSEFSYRDFNLKVGDVCDFQYEPGFDNKATLSDVVVLKPNDEPKQKDK